MNKKDLEKENFIDSKENMYIYKNHKKLRFGYTTGSCAAAASKASIIMLLSKKPIKKIQIMTPKKILLNLNGNLNSNERCRGSLRRIIPEKFPTVQKN